MTLISATESALSNEVSATPIQGPYIRAAVAMAPASMGYGSYEVDVCTSAGCATPITDATVRIGATTLAYDATDEQYVGSPSGSIAGM